METGDALTQWWIYGLSAIGGGVSFVQSFVIGDTWKTHSLKLTGRIITAIFAGVMSHQFAIALALPKTWLLLVVGIGAWRGTAALQAISQFLDKKNGAGEAEK